MARQEVIDLLSTDDEIHGQIPEKEFGTTKVQAKAVNAEFAVLSDDLDDNAETNGWTENPSKRRRRSPRSSNKNNILIPQLSPTTGNASSCTFSSKPEIVTSWKKQWVDLSDPIILTSSPHETATAGLSRKARSPPSQPNNEADDDFPNDQCFVALQQPLSVPQFSDRTAALLASIKAPPQRKASSRRKKPRNELENNFATRLLESEDDGNGPDTFSNDIDKPATTKPCRRPKLSDTAKATATREEEDRKAAEKARRAKEKEKETERKRLAKEEKAREKQIAADLAEANRSRMDKKLTTTEMIVDLPASIDGQSVDTQAREILKNLGVDTNVYQSPIPNVIKWRRKVDRVYNPERRYWDPLHKTVIQEEKHVMCLMTAKEFVALASASASDVDGQDLVTHVLGLKSMFEDCTPIYLIEGLNAWMRKNKMVRNRAYQVAVLNQDVHGENDSGTNEKQAFRRKKPTDQYVDENMVEDALLRLQVINNCLIHHTAATVETAEWVANFTQHISTIPYK